MYQVSIKLIKIYKLDKVDILLLMIMLTIQWYSIVILCCQVIIKFYLMSVKFIIIIIIVIIMDIKLYWQNLINLNECKTRDSYNINNDTQKLYIII